MSETGSSEFDVTDATDSPFECLTDGDGNGNGKGKRHVVATAAPADPQSLIISDHFHIPTRAASNAPVPQPVTPVQMSGSTGHGNEGQSSSPKLPHQPNLPVNASTVPSVAKGDSISGPMSQVSLTPGPEQPVTPPASGGEEEDGLFGWFGSGRGSLLSRVAEQAKNSVDSVITTLDPGMKEYLYTGGTVNIVVASDKECKVSPIREAFIDVFGRATVKGIGASPEAVVAAQPVGAEAAQVSAAQRIAYIRRHMTKRRASESGDRGS